MSGGRCRERLARNARPEEASDTTGAAQGLRSSVRRGGTRPVLAVGGIDPFGDEHPSPHCLTCVCRAPVRRPSAKTVRSRSSTSGLWCP